MRSVLSVLVSGRGGCTGYLQEISATQVRHCPDGRSKLDFTGRQRRAWAGRSRRPVVMRHRATVRRNAPLAMKPIGPRSAASHARSPPRWMLCHQGTRGAQRVFAEDSVETRNTQHLTLTAAPTCQRATLIYFYCSHTINPATSATASNDTNTGPQHPVCTVA